MDILSNIQAATEIAKKIMNAGNSYQAAEHKMELANLISALADAKQAILDKEAEINELKAKLSVKEKVIWEKPYYFLINNGTKDGPYCPTCYDKDGKLIRLQYIDTKRVIASGNWCCNICGNHYKDDSYHCPDIKIDYGYPT